MYSIPIALHSFSSSKEKKYENMLYKNFQLAE